MQNLLRVLILAIALTGSSLVATVDQALACGQPTPQCGNGPVTVPVTSPSSGDPVVPHGAVQAGCPSTSQEAFNLLRPQFQVAGTTLAIWRIEANGWHIRGAAVKLYADPNFPGVRIDWWNSATQQTGATYGGGWTDWTSEATLWLPTCNP